MARQGLEISSQALWDQQRALAEHLEPTWIETRARVLAEPVLRVDETGWRMMATEPSKWTLFGLTAPQLAAYRLTHSKSAATTRELLRGFAGTLVVDGFAVYPLVAALEGGRSGSLTAGRTSIASSRKPRTHRLRSGRSAAKSPSSTPSSEPWRHLSPVTRTSRPSEPG